MTTPEPPNEKRHSALSDDELDAVLASVQNELRRHVRRHGDPASLLSALLAAPEPTDGSGESGLKKLPGLGSGRPSDVGEPVGGIGTGTPLISLRGRSPGADEGGLGAGASGLGGTGAGTGGGPGAELVGGAGMGVGMGRSGMGGNPMGGNGTGAGGVLSGVGGRAGDDDNERSAWLSEDEDVWGDDDDTAPPVIG
ncbi:hypothetical protein [Actinomadura sp. 3N407]|uniref:hypothetical protein n=1 Tax=Actinomadura sp. 3N407 TaxID=3457423 RepID=UPI003FCDF5DD